MRLDRGQDGLGGEFGQTDVLRGCERRAKHPRAATQVKQRGGVQINHIRVEAEISLVPQRTEKKAAMGQHHALRSSGRAAGVDDGGQVVTAAQRIIGWRMIVDQRLIAMIGLAGVDERREVI